MNYHEGSCLSTTFNIKKLKPTKLFFIHVNVSTKRQVLTVLKILFSSVKHNEIKKSEVSLI